LRFPDFPERHTPLHKAALCCNYQALEVLIGAGADVNAADKVSRGGTDRAGVRWHFVFAAMLEARHAALLNIDLFTRINYW
jgi:hypothetical protein